MPNNKMKPSRVKGGNAVQNYVERKLLTLHDASAPAVTRYRIKLVSFVVGVVVMVMLPYLHIGVFYRKIWTPNKPEINRDGCTCDCFDTIFRGAYENPGKSMYKHVYFNATKETLSIWTFTIIFILMMYESVKYLIRIILESRLRNTMMFLFVINIYPNYYSWWSYFSYYNEEFFRYYLHHMVFTVTELVSTCFIMNLCDNRNATKPWKLWIIIAINCMHILSAGADQFMDHVVRGEGKNFQNARDIALMIPDVLLILVSLREIYVYGKTHKVGLRRLLNLDHVIMMAIIIGGGTLIGRVL